MLTDRPRLRDIKNTSTFRLTLLFGIIFMLGVAALLALIYGMTARELNARSDRILQLEAEQLLKVAPEELPRRVRSEIAQSASGLNYFGLQSRQGEYIAGNIMVAPEFKLDHPVYISPRPGITRPLRLLAIRTSSDETLLIGRDITPTVDLRKRMMLILVSSGFVVGLFVLVIGLGLSMAPLRRVRDLQKASREIAAGHFGTRMPILGRGDELDLFAATVNGMVEEVGRVLSQVKEVTDAIAHDLRTPLTHVRSQLYRAQRFGGLDPNLSQMIDSATDDLEIVLDRFAALLRISELEASERRAGFAVVDLRLLLQKCCDLFEPLAEERGIALSFEPDCTVAVHGDEKLIFEAISNIVDNSIKFTLPGGRILLSLKQDEQKAIIEISDNGPGIAEHERNAVLLRFHRGAAAAETPGSGLGLSVVAAILHLHGFSLELDDAKPGLIVRMRCPIRR
jgi:signal transduction histidine kinase